MYSFLNDYSETAHPAILKALLATNMEQTVGYGFDPHSCKAVAYMKEKMQAPQADIHLLVGGTQTNLLAAAAFLGPVEAVVSADTGHIHVHETASVEATGHKILAVPTPDGKLTVADLARVVAENSEENTPRPRMAYVSNTTELGTLYTKDELLALYAFCQANDMYLFIDGARIGSALACADGPALADYPRLCDAFYIGGTKNGAMMGEAMVLLNPALQRDFRRHMKQRGAILAKGKALGIQFEELFRDDLFMENARHGNAMAAILREGIRALGYTFMVESPSNQIFPIYPNTVMEKMREKYLDSTQKIIDAEHTCVRLVTCWATEEPQVRAYLADLAAVTKNRNQ